MQNLLKRTFPTASWSGIIDPTPILPSDIPPPHVYVYFPSAPNMRLSAFKDTFEAESICIYRYICVGRYFLNKKYLYLQIEILTKRGARRDRLGVFS